LKARRVSRLIDMGLHSMLISDQFSRVKDEIMDLKQLKAIMDMFEKSGLSELCLKMKDEEICLKKSSPVSGLIAAYQPALHAPQPAAEVSSSTSTAKEHTVAAAADVEVIRAPIVGTFYRAPAPDAPPFVERGARAKKGQTLCILEAMKLMNEFQAEFDLSVVNILAENGKMVEFGTPLFEVRRI
jgi:acetyl-CoA carboxylase biotin carboxyl carrier protein